MRPTPIPGAEIWQGATRIVVAPPGGDMTHPDIAPVEALVDRSPSTGHQTLSTRCVLEDDDLAKLEAGGTVWLTFWGRMVPWAATVLPPAGGAALAEGCRWVDCQTEGDHEHEPRQAWVNPGDPGAGKYGVVFDDQGTVRISEAALAQLLTDAGWERAR